VQGNNFTGNCQAAGVATEISHLFYHTFGLGWSDRGHGRVIYVFPTVGTAQASRWLGRVGGIHWSQL